MKGNLNYKQPDQINDQINDLALLILRVVKGKPGLNVPQILDEIKRVDILLNEIRNMLNQMIISFIS